jgi:hypothetical protein
MKVGSWQFYVLTLSIVIVLFVICHCWDKYDKYKQLQAIKRLQNKVTLDP